MFLRTNKKFVRRYLLAFLFALCLPLQFAAAAQDCKSALERINFSNQTQFNFDRVDRDLFLGLSSKYLILPLGYKTPGHGEFADGFIIKVKEPAASLPPEIIKVDSGSHLNFFNKLVWTMGREKYDFFNFGFKSFEDFSRKVNGLVLEHLKSNPNRDLAVVYPPARVYIGQILQQNRWLMHDAVLEKYKEKKEYLAPIDFMYLRYLNTLSDNSDVFGLIRHSPTVFPEVLSKSQMKDDLFLTIQVSYFGDRSFLKPTFRELLLAGDVPLHNGSDRLPFEYRLRRHKTGKLFREYFYGEFNPKETCEITRYTLFDSTLPISIKDMAIFKVFQTIVDRGMKNIVIGVDAGTGKLFGQRYGFQYYGELPVPKRPAENLENSETVKKEYLYVLRVNSPEFHRIFKALEKSALAVNSILGVQQ